MSRLPKRVVAAANRFRSGPHKDLIIVGVRHFDELMIAQLHALGYTPNNPPDMDQGFVDNDYDFLHRNDAWTLALSMNQIHLAAGTTRGCLHSEDLY